jgi:hypothetical protein
MISAKSDVVAAMAVDQDPAQAHAAHLAERDLQRPTVRVRRFVAFWARHDAIKAAPPPTGKITDS